MRSTRKAGTQDKPSNSEALSVRKIAPILRVFTAVSAQISDQAAQSVRPTLELFGSLGIIRGVWIAPLLLPERQGDPAKSPSLWGNCTGFR